MDVENAHVADANPVVVRGEAEMDWLEGEHDDRVIAVRHQPVTGAQRRLRVEHRAVLRPLIDHLLPDDTLDTIHAEAVLDAIDIRIASDSADADMPLAQVYRSGCERIQAHAVRRFGRRVQALTPRERDQIIWDMLENAVDDFDAFSSAWFFGLIRRDIADAIGAGRR